MIIPDVSVLIHAYNSNSPVHAGAKRWWAETLSSGRPVGLAWVAVIGFIRVMTHRAALQNPMSVADATRRTRSWLETSNVQIVTPGDGHADVLFELLESVGTAGNLTTDAHLAALAIEYQAEIATTDMDFARFQGLRWFNPLAKTRRRNHRV